MTDSEALTEARVTDAMVEAALAEAGWLVEPYTAPRESGVPIESDMSQADADEINAACRETMRGILSAALSALGTAPAVKKLEWTDDVVATTPFGSYTISEDADDKWHFTYHEYPYGTEDDVAYETVEAAKAACQADFEERIRSALVASPLSANAAEIRADET